MKPQDGAEQPDSAQEQQEAADDQEARVKRESSLWRKQTGLRFLGLLKNTRRRCFELQIFTWK